MLPRDHYLKQTFQDTAHFPNGFEKGGLSDIQARLVRKNGHLITALVADEVSDPSSEDLHILKVIANQSAPKSPVEQAWVKYLNIVKAAASTGTKKASKAKAAKPVEEESEPVAEPKASKAKPAAKTTVKEEEPKAEKAKPKAKAATTKAAPTEEAKPAKKTKAKA